MKKLKLIFLSMLLVLSLAFISACNNSESNYDIITTLYPQYDIVNNIVKDKLTHKLLTPAGIEVHGFEPTAKDIVQMNDSKLVLYTSNKLEPWMEGISNNNPLKAINLSTIVDESFTNKDDVHYWTDTTIYLEMINIILEQIIQIDIINEEFYRTNASTYYNQVLNLHNEILTYVETNNNIQIFLFGHNAMEAFSNIYNIDIVTINDHYQPDGENTMTQIQHFKNKIKEANTNYLFVEELSDYNKVNTLKDELANEGYLLNILELHSYHNMRLEQFEKEVSYYDLLKQNFENIKQATNLRS